MTRNFGRILLGIAAVLIVATIVKLSTMGPSAALEVAGIAAGVGLIGMAAGIGLLRLLRGSPVGVQAAAVATVASGTVALCVVLAARAMILGSTGTDALAVIVVAGAAVGVILALWLGDRLGKANEGLLEAARNLGDETPLDLSNLRETSAETRELAEELTRTSARLETARTRQRELEEARDELVAWISHDLRTPLAGIRAVVEALEDGVISDPREVDEAYSNLQTQSDRLTSLVDDLFALSKSRAGLIAHQRTEIDLDDLVSDCVAGLRSIADRKSITITPDSGESAVSVIGAPGELGRAVGNIIDNAIRFTPAHGEIVIRLSTTGQTAVLEIADSGLGIPAEHIGRVFEPGYQVNPARTPGGGSGLGLAISRGIVEAHGGTLTAANAESGSGAVFTLSLPTTVNQLPQPTESINQN